MPFQGNTIKFKSGYRYTVPELATKAYDSIGFYCAYAPRKLPLSSVLAMDDAGSKINLRLLPANDVLRDNGYGSLARIDGYYCDSYCEDTMIPIVARLPKSRGFLAGWTMGAGMCASLETKSIYDDVEEAARAAHSITESAAEREREYQEDEAAREREGLYERAGLDEDTRKHFDKWCDRVLRGQHEGATATAMLEYLADQEANEQKRIFGEGWPYLLAQVEDNE